MTQQLNLFDNIDETDNTLQPAGNEREQILSLRRELAEQNYKYYVLSAPTMSDQEFDQKMHLLEQLEQKHPELFDPASPTQRVGSDLQKKSGFQQMEHRHPMLSLANTYSEQDISQWYNRVAKELRQAGVEQAPEVVCEIKYDGLSISLWYENGVLQHALTRGDGTRGDDVIDNIRTIKSIPWQVDYHRNPALSNFEIRGEVLLPWQSFERLNKEREEQEEPLFANPRNAASGTLKLLDPKVVAQRGLEAYLYYFITDTAVADTHYDSLLLARDLGFNISPAMRVCHSINEIMEFISYWDTERRTLPVATDGIVLKVNNLQQQQLLGYTAKTPRWAIAYKFQAERQQTRLTHISYQVGRTGIITPVANLEPVQLSGTIVKRATLHNEDFVRQLGIQDGDIVWVEKGGEIIPKITGKVNEHSSEQSLPYKFITTCPECGTPLVRDPEQAAWRCPNEDQCPPQQKGKIQHFVERKAMNIDGLGDETIDLFFSRHLITNIADIYDLRADDILALEGFQQRSAQIIIDGIEQSKQVPWSRVLFALGIRYVGETTAKKLAKQFPSIDSLASADEEQLRAVDDVGGQIALSIMRYFANPANKTIIERLKAAGVQLKADDDIQPVSDKLRGKNIVISGTFALHSRDEYKQMIEQNGGHNASSVSKNTSFILAGDNMGPQKLEKARQLGIEIIDEQQFLQLIS
ncbi:MAG: NAD-dependent DNA ligase LigA [Paludibacteraceae bacterium]|nr:NAD-dependent DNA ligase LigA [Paludibacteraceae bacterium]